jgi:hypothetical protein
MEAIDDLVRSHVPELPTRDRLQKPIVGPQALDLFPKAGVLLEERDGLLPESLPLCTQREEPRNTIVPEDQRAEHGDDGDQQDDRQQLPSAPPHARSLVTESMQGGNGQV